MSLPPLSDIFIRFAIITAVAVVWCSLSIPVEGVDNVVEENLAGVQDCLKAIQEVQKEPDNEETVKKFLDLCKEFIDQMDLNENQTAILEKAGYKTSKKLKDKVEENDIGDKVTDKKDKTEESDQKVTPDKKDHTISDKQDKDDGTDNITHKDDDDVKKEKEDIKQRKLNKKKDEHLKKIHKDDLNTDGKSKAEETETQSQEAKISDPEIITKTEHPDIESQDKQIPQNEQEQNQNLQEDPSLFDFSIFDIPGMTPEERAKTIEELKEIRRIIKMPTASQPEVQMHASFPDPSSQGILHPQFGQQFSQGIPQFQYQEQNVQFQDPAFAAGVPQDPAFAAGVPQDPAFAAGVPQDPAFAAGVLQDPAFAAGVPHMNMKFDQVSGIPKASFQQNNPPFPQQAEFAGHFQHQHFDQGIPQVPPAPEWVTTFPDQEFGQGIPQPNNEATWNIVNEAFKAPDQQQTQPPNEAPTVEEFPTKRKIDEL